MHDTRSTKTKGILTAMGMAASQARFLGLTARKNNVEFEGQQVNQQRTTLSNQSANYYNDLLGMAVPIPPSVDDYTKTVYTFADGALTNQITAMIAQADGNYKVSYLRQWVDDFSVVSATTSIVNTINKETGPYMVGAQQLRTLCEDLLQYSENVSQCTESELANLLYAYEDANGNLKTAYKGDDGKFYADAALSQLLQVTDDDGTKKDAVDTDLTMYLYLGGHDPETSTAIVTKADDGTYNKTVKMSSKSDFAKNDDYLKTLSEDQILNLIKEEQEYIQLLQAKYGSGDYMIRYIKNTTTEEWSPYFYRKQDLETAIYDSNTGNSQSNINCYKIGSETKTEEVKAVSDCKIEKDSSGRYINLTMPQHDSEGNKVSGTEVTYALTTSTVTDQDKYEDAMNQYEFEKYQYDQAVQDINSKIEIVQSEDKNLELRLKQLDTEQKAISTELESVGQVIQKNTESSFKTFG